MEELFAYALLYSVGYDFWHLYSAQLDKLFLESPDNEEYLYLETLKSPTNAALHLISVMSNASFDADIFGRTLMKLIAEVYSHSDLPQFSRKMYLLWNSLPTALQDKEPFLPFCYADDCLSYGYQTQCRKLLEEAIHYYDEYTV